MKKSIYRIIMFVLQIINVCLLIVLSVHFDLIHFEFTWLSKEQVFRIINNAYFTNIASTIFAAIILYFVQVKYSKRKIKKDFRCNEIINDLYYGIETAFKLTDISVKLKTKKEQDETQIIEYNAKRLANAKRYVCFFEENIADFYISNLALTYYNNDLLIESVQTVFFINLNFKLLNIVNNIKNRKPNLEKLYPKIEKTYDNYKENNNDELTLKLGEMVENYLIDLDFMAKYWLALIDYLGYDPLPVKIYIETFNRFFDTEDEKNNFFKLPLTEQNKIYKKIQKESAILCIKKKMKDFFK